MRRLNQRRHTGVGFYCAPGRSFAQRSTRQHGASEQMGDGIITDKLVDLKDRFIKKFLENRPKVMNDLLKAEGDQQIVEIEVCRNPIKGIYEKLLNVLSFGQLKRRMKAKGYDKLYHLYMVIHLANGKVFSLEKNQRVKIIDGKKLKPDGECTPGLKNPGFTLNEMITTAEKKSDKHFYRYDGFKHNCQKWLRSILNSNGINQFNSFISQDVEELAPAYLKIIAKGVTDIAGVFDFISKGGALPGNVPGGNALEGEFEEMNLGKLTRKK